MKRLLGATLLLLSIASAAFGKQSWDTLIYTHDRHEQKYKVGNCDVCHVSILKSKKARDDNYADDQSCNKTGCHDIKNQDSCFTCHTNSSAKSPLKSRREIKFSHKKHAGMPPVVTREAEPETGSPAENETIRKGEAENAQAKMMAIYEKFCRGDTAGARAAFEASPLLKRKYSYPEAFQLVGESAPGAKKGKGRAGSLSLGIECRVCHSYIDSTFYYDRNDMPPMALCLLCHQKERANTNCIHCHSNPAIILSHSPGGRGDHGPLYGQSPRSCETCHDNNFCGKCHSGQIAEHVHPSNYLYLHSYDVFNGSMQCETCHDTRQSCDGCHQRSWGRIVDHRKVILSTTSCKSCHRSK